MGSGPQVPDAKQLTQQQQSSNIATAVAQTNLNSTNQNTPFGSLQYSQIGTWPDGTPRYQANTTLSPQQQQLYNTSVGTQQNIANVGQQQSGQLGGLLNQPMNTPSYQQFGNGPALNTQGGQMQMGNSGGSHGGGDPNPSVDPMQGPQGQTLPRGPQQAGPGTPVGGGIQNRYDTGGNVTDAIADAGGIRRGLSTNDYGAERQRVEDALMGRLNQQYGQDRTSLESSLANKGIKQGSAAYTAAMNDYGRNVAEGRTSAILGAGQEQNRLQGLDLNAGNFANAAQAQQYGQNANNAGFANSAQAQRNSQNAAAAGFNNAAQNQNYGQTMGNAAFSNAAQQQMFQNNTGTTAANNQLAQQQQADDFARRNQSINQLQALMGGSQIQAGGFAQTPQSSIQTVDGSGNAWNQYNAQQQQSNGMWNAIGSVGGTLGGWLLSDERLKTDKKRIGETPEGVGVYNYRYKGSPMMQMGVLAQEVKKTQPEAVKRTPSGFLAVDYRKVK